MLEVERRDQFVQSDLWLADAGKVEEEIKVITKKLRQYGVD